MKTDAKNIEKILSKIGIGFAAWEDSLWVLSVDGKPVGAPFENPLSMTWWEPLCQELAIIIAAELEPEPDPTKQFEQERAMRQAAQIYDMYPRKVGKKVALKKIAKAIGEVGFERIYRSTEAFVKAWHGASDLQYCPHPGTFYGQGRYEDDPKTWGP